MGNRRTAHRTWAARCVSLLFASAVVVTDGALAHALVMSSMPAARAAVPAGALRIELRFNSRIDVKRSRIALRAPGGTESVLGKHADDSRAVLFGTAEARRTGDWAIVWQVLSLDGHVTRGEIPFRVEDAPLK
jgi:methionine-rich copper-binding protein CopC